jgi:hypothetical protein
LVVRAHILLINFHCQKHFNLKQEQQEENSQNWCRNFVIRKNLSFIGRKVEYTYTFRVYKYSSVNLRLSKVKNRIKYQFIQKEKYHHAMCYNE